MSICEGCLKQDVCKFKARVERYEKRHKIELPEPMAHKVYCKYYYKA